MIGRLAHRYGYRIAIAALLLAIGAVGAFLVVVAVPDLVRFPDRDDQAAASASPSPGASGQSAMARSPVGISMPAGTDCSSCHLTTDGVVGTKTIPVMAHPLWGWQNCTACHATGSLVASAPGHSSLHKDDCLICHRAPDSTSASASAPPLRPEHMGGNQPCTACHGVDKHAPMPANMVGRGDNCWICHNGPEFKYLFESPSPSASAVAQPSAVADQLGSPSPNP